MQRLMLRSNGGLGNQIFQYAAGLYFSKRTSRSLEIVRPFVPVYDRVEKFPRPFQLDAFAPARHIRSATKVDRLFLSEKPVIKCLQNSMQGICGTEIIEEPAFYRFFPWLLDRVDTRKVYLVGYWQAAGYAKAVEDDLRRSLSLSAVPQQRNVDYADSIRALPCPVSVHIRVGDYAVHTSSAGEVNWVLRRSYFHAAIDRIRSLIPDASFVVFSDDHIFAQKILSGVPVSLWVDGNTASNAYEDMWLMSYCKHHIIANSTFSWWGAWLNASPSKIVLAPRYWHNTYDSFFPDLYPSNWILLDNLA